MKKIFILLFSCLFLVGCDSTANFTKECTENIDSKNITDSKIQEITYNNNDEVLNVVITRTYKAKDNKGIKILENIKKSADSYNNNLAKSKAIKIKNIINESDKYVIRYELDVTKMNSSELEEFNLKKNSIKLFSKLKKDGISCKMV